MTIDQQQVNVTELQRLNEAIMLTMDAIRRVVPQLAQQGSPMGIGMGVGGQNIDPLTAVWLQTQALRSVYGQPWQQGQYGQPSFGSLGQVGFGGMGGIGQGIGQGFGQGGLGAIAQHPIVQQLLTHHLMGQHMFGQSPFGAQQFGAQQPFGGQFSVGQQPFGGQSLGQYGTPFGGQTPWQVPFGASFGGWPSPVSYGGMGGTQRPF